MSEERWDIYDKDRNKTGMTIKRGDPMTAEMYHVVVQIWIRNKQDQWLISKRTPNKTHPLKWEVTGGAVSAGEDSLTAALREVKEEVGICLDPQKGRLFASYRRDIDMRPCPGFLDVWYFEHDCPIEEITLQEGETCDAKWATEGEIREMMRAGEFLGFLPDYFEDFFSAMGKQDEKRR